MKQINVLCGFVVICLPILLVYDSMITTTICRVSIWACHIDLFLPLSFVFSDNLG